MKLLKFVVPMILTVMALLCYSKSSAQVNRRIFVRQDDDLVRVFETQNAFFIIEDDLDLEGQKVRIGGGSVIVFRGGTLSNGIVEGTNTRVEADDYEIFKRGYVRYRAYIEEGAKRNAPPSVKIEYHDCLFIEGTWDNSYCGKNWTGLLDNNQEDIMLAIKNFVTLHKNNAEVSFPTINAIGYERAELPGNHIIDFNHSTISYPDDLSIWEDKSITIPETATPCSLESSWGFVSIKGNTTIKNLTIDGKSEHRKNEIIRKGVSCLLYIGITDNVVIENVSIINALGPAVCSHSRTKNVLFKNCRFYNIGEHVIYSHQNLGFCHFVDCSFDTWDSERISEYRDGFDYLFKHVPLYEEHKITYEELYSFDLSFTKCTFNNPRRVNSQGRTIGGFFTGTFPVVIHLTDCKFTGAYPIINPGKGSLITEKVGKAYRLVARGCDGAPYVYSGKSNCNIITEFYDCVNIPFRTVYAKRYEKCRLFLDVYESDVENVTPGFEREFSEPLIIKDCFFTYN